MRIRDIAMSRPRFGYERIHVLLRREGWHVNLKRVHKVVLSGRSSSAHAGTPKEAYEPAPWAGTSLQDQDSAGVWILCTISWSMDKRSGF